MEIQLTDLHKTFGNKVILDNLNLTIGNGEVWCLLGTNGAGKTTLINILLTLLRPEVGSVAYDGEVYHQLPQAVKRRIGVMGENNPVIEELTAFQFLQLTGKLYQVDAGLLPVRIQDLVAYFFDEDILHRRLSGFSTGMKKKIGLIAAILHTPDLLILDEPFSGLDPLAAQQSIDFLNSYRSDSRAIFLSSHDLSYVQQVATHVAVLHNQQLTFAGSMEAFTAGGTTHINSALLDLLQPETQQKKKIEWL
ncbi:ABC transporter ATP-binding protein [Pontibacter roseus]|uniref:ABC transporter ATP-binding protein n=1 Tax=Pontibacter roseus TaxID=336989 RepID=UPI000371E82D|nr:ABC transporter ATP-binding protein [Pontibacter roseus]